MNYIYTVTVWYFKCKLNFSANNGIVCLPENNILSKWTFFQVHQLRTKCPVCKKVLSRHYHMKVHLLTVHKVPDAEIEGLLRSQNIV